MSKEIKSCNNCSRQCVCTYDRQSDKFIREQRTLTECLGKFSIASFSNVVDIIKRNMADNCSYYRG